MDCIYISTQKEVEKNETSIEELYTSIGTLKNLTIAFSRSKIAYPVLEEKHIDETRKILEYVYTDPGTEILLNSTYEDLLKKIKDVANIQIEPQKRQTKK